MTVTKNKQTYTFPSTTSGNSSDVESLHVGSASASDAGSVNNEPHRPFVPPVYKNTTYEDLIVLKKCSGKKKLRRFHNRHLLQTLAEEEEESEGALVVIMEPYKSPFAKLLEDDDALQFWNIFIDKSEEEQEKMLGIFSGEPKKSAPKPRISSRIKRTIKIKKNISLEHVKQSENDIISFFTITPKEVNVQFPQTYFERMILHAIAQYHGLQSLGLNENGVKRIEIYNNIPEWVPANCFLSDFISQMRQRCS